MFVCSNVRSVKCISRVRKGTRDMLLTDTLHDCWVLMENSNPRKKWRDSTRWLHKTLPAKQYKISFFLGFERDSGQERGGDGAEDHWEGEGGVQGSGWRCGQERIHQTLLKQFIIKYSTLLSLDKIHKSLNAFPLLQTPPHQNYHLKVVDMKMYQVCHSALNWTFPSVNFE